MDASDTGDFYDGAVEDDADGECADSAEGTDDDLDSGHVDGSVLDSGPDGSTSAGWRFVAVGDSRGSSTGSGHNKLILAEIVAAAICARAELVLFVGDLIYGTGVADEIESDLSAWRETVGPLLDAGIEVYPVRGNHEIGSIDSWRNIFGGDLPDSGPDGERHLTYAVNHENALFLGLDLYVTPHRVNQEWIDEQLEGTSAQHVFAFAHEPAFSAGHADCLDDYPGNRDAFWRSLKGAGARVFFAGHDHFYAHARIGEGDAETDLHQYIVGTGGAPLVAVDDSYDGDNGDATPILIHSESAYGFLLVEVDGLRATLTWMERVAPGVFVKGEAWTYTVNID